MRHGEIPGAIATAESSTVFRLQPSLFQSNLYAPISFFRYAFPGRYKRIAAAATNYRSARGINPPGSEDSYYTHCALTRKIVVQSIAPDLIGMTNHSKFRGRQFFQVDQYSYNDRQEPF
ncbi:MAG: hypothetical protein A2V78_09400 [Betaproteobacteria bacterium RBG_16_64_18]|nr:MAG: hypothetical protein A2V78_09400 [Betaproteobacteria bacterium RBG_16_64_18]